jgi:hypothetical protein
MGSPALQAEGPASSPLIDDVRDNSYASQTRESDSGDRDGDGGGGSGLQNEDDRRETAGDHTRLDSGFLNADVELMESHHTIPMTLLQHWLIATLSLQPPK